MLPGERRQFLFACVLPGGMMPSFKGLGVRYFYNASVSVYSRLRSNGFAERHFHCPFSIASHGLPSTSNIKYVTTSTISVRELHGPAAEPKKGEGDARAASGAAQQLQRRKYASAGVEADGQFRRYDLDGVFPPPQPVRDVSGLLGERSAEALALGNVRSRSVTSFRIRHGANHICEVSFSKKEWRCGDAVQMALLFSDCGIPTTSVSASLDLEEHSKHAATRSRCVQSRRVETKTLSVLKSHSTFLQLHIPADGPVAFHTPLVRAEWILRFTFTVLVPRTPEKQAEWDSLREQALRPSAAPTVSPALRIVAYAEDVMDDFRLEALHWSTPLRVRCTPQELRSSISRQPSDAKDLADLGLYAGVPQAVLEGVDAEATRRRTGYVTPIEEDLRALANEDGFTPPDAPAQGGAPRDAASCLRPTEAEDLLRHLGAGRAFALPRCMDQTK